MKKIYFILTVILSIGNSEADAQYNGNVWVFGDSAGINFNTSSPSPIISGMESIGGSSTICDSIGNMLFYCYGYDYYLEQLGYRRSGIVKNKNHITMQNGDSLTAEWYHDMIIVPKSVTDSTFYVFCAGVSRDYGLYYSLIDLKQNNGLGAVVQKNIQLQSFPVIDGLSVIKHGNGKDWWLVFQRASVSSIDSSDEYFVYKIDSAGISTVLTQNIGSKRIANGGDLSFNAEGNKLIYIWPAGGIELFDFDRCTGTISNLVTIETQRPLPPYPVYTIAVFSPNSRFVYIVSVNEVNNHANNYLYQYDLTASNIAGSRIVIDSFPYLTGIWSMEMGPDHKIYMSAMFETYGYPYPDTLHNSVTDNLSVINSPDSLGAACDFQPFSYYLGGQRTYYGLPNNPDYTLGPLDTITTVHEIKQQHTQNELKVFYHTQWDIAFINADKLHGKKYTLHVFDITGKEIFKEQGNLQPPYFTKDLGMSAFAKGVYIVTLQTEMEVLSKKFVKY